MTTQTQGHAVRPLYWSIRRELWENRSIYIAPLAVAALLLAGFASSPATHARLLHHIATLQPPEQAEQIAVQFNVGALSIIFTSLMVGVFYCLGALHNERRDRSILFWKSLPVSDVTTVLAKASIPVLVLPLITFAIVIVTQLIVLAGMAGIALANGLSPGMLLVGYSPLPRAIIILYLLVVLALWNAPIYGWLMLVSAWARSKIFLWATLPPLALCVVEKMALNTTRLGSMLGRHIVGFFPAAFDIQNPTSIDIGQLSQLDPSGFLTSAGLWEGLGLALVFAAATIWLRRYRDPI